MDIQFRANNTADVDRFNNLVKNFDGARLGKAFFVSTIPCRAVRQASAARRGVTLPPVSESRAQASAVASAPRMPWVKNAFVEGDKAAAFKQRYAEAGFDPAKCELSI